MQMLTLPKLTALILASPPHPPSGARRQPPYGTVGDEFCLENPAIDFAATILLRPAATDCRGKIDPANCSLFVSIR